MFVLCSHTMPSGKQCQSPAMRGTRFCYFHRRRWRYTRRPTLGG